MIQTYWKWTKITYKNTDVYYSWYIAIKSISDYESIHGGNPLYFLVGEVNGYIAESDGNKSLVFASTDKNKEVLENNTELWD